ncbi:MAG: NADH-quinone oxidoreductase subunit C [Actinomycetota bacterium]|nr:NADH-quinone oxidoreductase subunit C [Actinomycetota bacterium]
MMPDAPGLELIAQGIGDAHPGAVLGTYHEHDQACLIADPEQILAVLGWLRDTPGQEYRFLASLHGVDYLPAEPRFGVVYELLNRDRVERIRVKALLADPEQDVDHPIGSGGEAEQPTGIGSGRLPELASCVEMFPTADFQEREVYDFFGIRFRGHPDLRRILMPEVYVGWPQRRDFPIGGEPVIFTHNERVVPGWSQ